MESMEKTNIPAEITTISNMLNKTMKVSEQTHTRLKVFAAQRGLSLGEAIDLLLEEHKESPPGEEVK
jgi:hypothetical protein